MTNLLATTAWSQQTSPPVPNGEWELLTAAQPAHVWGVFPSAAACMAGQKQLHMQAMNALSSMRGVTPDEFSAAANKLQSIDAASCVQG